MRISHVLRKPPNINGFISTLNKMGYMVTSLDPYSIKFIETAVSMDSSALDIGAAYGIATIEALKAGAKKVIANDISKDHLKVLYKETPEHLRTKLALAPGAFPNEINFKSNSIGCVLISRVLHLFPGDIVEEALNKVYRWLEPKGKVFIVCDTPYIRNLINFIPTYEIRKNQGYKWPGFIKNFKTVSPIRGKNLPRSMNLMDHDVLARALERVGFVIEEKGLFSRDDFPEDSRLDGREGAGVVAAKY